MSAVAALAVTSPFAYVAYCQSVADTKPAPEQHRFVQATAMADLPGEVMNALSQGLSQFGITLPPVPALSGSSGYSPGMTSSGLTSPGLSPGPTSPGLTSPGLTSPGLTSPDATPGLTTPGATTPGLTDPALTNPALTDPSGTVPGLTSPTGVDPSLNGPVGLGGGNIPVSAPIGLDPGADGTYPILGDPSVGAAPSGSGGLVNDVMNVANQLGASQAIDLIKGLVMPSITQAIQSAAQGGAAPAAAALPALPAPAA